MYSLTSVSHVNPKIFRGFVFCPNDIDLVCVCELHIEFEFKND
jgi:hypothetical protein